VKPDRLSGQPAQRPGQAPRCSPWDAAARDLPEAQRRHDLLPLSYPLPVTDGSLAGERLRNTGWDGMGWSGMG